MAGVKGRSGGARPGGGRPSKAEELKLAERLSPLEPLAYNAIMEGLEKKEFAFVKLFMEYYYGRPTEHVNLEGQLSQTINWIRPDNDTPTT